MIADNVTPSRLEILSWLQEQDMHRIEADLPQLYQVDRDAELDQIRASWARALEGMPWRWIRPVVQIATESKIHPIAVMSLTAKWSTDAEFIEAAQRQVAKHGGGAS